MVSQSTKKDAAGNTTSLVEHEKVVLGAIIQKNQRAAFYATGEGLVIAQEQMEKKGIKNYTEALGAVLFNTTDPYGDDDRGEKRNWLKGELGFLVAKASGYDTYVSFNENKGEPSKRNSYFINSTTYNLNPTKEKLAEIVPGTIIVRKH